MGEENKWEQNVACVVANAVKAGLIEPAMELMCNHSLMGPAIMDQLKINEHEHLSTITSNLDANVISTGVDKSHLDAELEKARRRVRELEKQKYLRDSRT